MQKVYRIAYVNRLTPTVATWIMGIRMPTAIKFPVPDRVKASFVIFDI